jgi:hypothetical protein
MCRAGRVAVPGILRYGSAVGDTTPEQAEVLGEQEVGQRKVTGDIAPVRAPDDRRDPVRKERRRQGPFGVPAGPGPSLTGRRRQPADEVGQA